MRKAMAGVAGGVAALVVWIGVAAATDQQTAPAAPPVPPTPPADRGTKLERIAEIIASAMDTAHSGAAWRTHAAFRCDVALKLGDTTFDGRLTVQVNGPAARLDREDGTAIFFDGQSTWVTPATSMLDRGPATCVRAWRELLVLPFVAHNSQVKPTEFRSMYAVGRDTDAFVITDKPADGRTPRAPARVYADVRSHQLVAIGCSDLPERLGLAGQAPPRAVVFSDMTAHEGVTLPMTWLLYDWTEAAGVRGEALGSITLTNAQFLRSDQVEFNRPADAREVGKPAAATQPVAPAKP